jgi:8-oxo-dGTP diphosphatase
MVFHYLVRGIIQAGGKVLLTHKKGANNTYLPGGHVNLGERAVEALAREIREEMGNAAQVKGFRGAVEHTWTEEGVDNHEINLVFEVEVPGLESTVDPESLEPDIEFIWSEVADLESHNLQPYPLIECLENLKREYRCYWGSSIRGGR